MLRPLIRLGAMVIALSVPFVLAATDPQEHRFAIKGIIVDQSGAVIPQAEVLFKGESGTIVAHVATDGSVNVNLDAGKYLVTISAFGFATEKIVDFPVPAPTPDAFRVSLKFDQSQVSYGSDFGHSGTLSSTVPTIPSELPNAVPVTKNEPARTSSSVAQPAAAKRRSIRCLYLWRCAIPRP